MWLVGCIGKCHQASTSNKMPNHNYEYAQTQRTKWKRINIIEKKMKLTKNTNKIRIKVDADVFQRKNERERKRERDTASKKNIATTTERKKRTFSHCLAWYYKVKLITYTGMRTSQTDIYWNGRDFFLRHACPSYIFHRILYLLDFSIVPCHSLSMRFSSDITNRHTRTQNSIWIWEPFSFTYVSDVCSIQTNCRQKALYVVFLLRMFVYTFGFEFMYPWFFGREMKKACILEPLWPFTRYILYIWIYKTWESICLVNG